MGNTVESLALEEAIQLPEMKQTHGGGGPHVVGCPPTTTTFLVVVNENDAVAGSGWVRNLSWIFFLQQGPDTE